MMLWMNNCITAVQASVMGSITVHQNHIIFHATFVLLHLVNVIKKQESADLISNLSPFGVMEWQFTSCMCMVAEVPAQNSFFLDELF